MFLSHCSLYFVYFCDQFLVVLGNFLDLKKLHILSVRNALSIIFQNWICRKNLVVVVFKPGWIVVMIEYVFH